VSARDFRKVFTYWDQGFNNAPPVIRACRTTLERYNPDWELHFLDFHSVQDWLEPVPIPAEKWNQMSLAHRSDVIRTQLLIRYGGVWADPTVLFTQPLNDWLPERMSAGVFMFHRPGRDRVVSNWFIAAALENPLLVRQYDRLCEYWRENDFRNFDRSMGPMARAARRLLNRNLELPRLWLRKPVIRLLKAYPYMIYHYMIYDNVRSKPELRALWERMPKVSADIPHFAVHRGLLEPLDDEAKRFIDSGEAPLFKLTWKLASETVPPGSVLDYLLVSHAAAAQKAEVLAQ